MSVLLFFYSHVLCNCFWTVLIFQVLNKFRMSKKVIKLFLFFLIDIFYGCKPQKTPQNLVLVFYVQRFLKMVTLFKSNECRTLKWLSCMRVQDNNHVSPFFSSPFNHPLTAVIYLLLLFFFFISIKVLDADCTNV